MANENGQDGRIENVNLSKTMRKSFLEYAMSVIVARALPDVRDGLKPVQRRILYGMSELGVTLKNLIRSPPESLGTLWGSTIHMVIQRFMKQWCGWRKNLVIVTC